jgi:hypothetical protein
MKKKKCKDANYSFKQDEPGSVFGKNDFANMPSNPMFMTLSKKHEYRDGIVNSFTNDLEPITHIEENQR